MSFYLFFKGLGIIQADPLTQKARQIVKRQLWADAKRYAAESQDFVELHNHVDLYFGGLDQRALPSSKAMQRCYLKKVLHDKPLRIRIAAVRSLLLQQEQIEIERELAKRQDNVQTTLTLKTGIRDAPVFM